MSLDIGAMLTTIETALNKGVRLSSVGHLNEAAGAYYEAFTLYDGLQAQKVTELPRALKERYEIIRNSITDMRRSVA